MHWVVSEVIRVGRELIVWYLNLSTDDLKKDKKNGKLLTSHRYNRLPLLHSCPGGVQQELVV